MTDWQKEYEKYPEREQYHRVELDRLENETYSRFILNSPVLSRTWLNIAVLHNHQAAMGIILDRLGVTADKGITLKQRLALYQLLEHQC